jgi:broad specificity phosphatase PhoE
VIALVRHGQTLVNRSGRLQGRTDPELTALGLAQAERLAACLAAASPAVVRTSPLRRAVATAEVIAARAGVRVEVDDRLVELDYGEWDGRVIADIPREAWARWRDDGGFAPPGGESLRDVAARMARFCEEQLTEQLVVAVGHVSPIKAAVAWALGADETTAWRMHLDLASITRIGGRPGAAALVTFNETTHLLDLEDHT